MKNKAVIVKWVDSYSIYDRWTDFPNNFKADLCIVESWGKLVYEDKRVIALANNIANETEHTNRSVSGVMIIPKVCIKKITSF